MEKQIFDDSRFINPETLPFYANTNEEQLRGPVRGIVVELPGLGGGSCLGGDMNRAPYLNDYTREFAENGVVVAYMFPGPWSWGNKGAVRMTDAVVHALAVKYGLPEGFPLVVCGGSMGGLGALMYAAGTTHRLAGVAAACPCIDVVDRLDSHPDFPRTYISAAAVYDLPMEQALAQISPAEHIGELPDIPYFICSDGEDEVFPEAQCDGYVAALQARGLRVTYRRQPGLVHGGFLPEVRAELHRFMLDIAAGRGVDRG